MGRQRPGRPQGPHSNGWPQRNRLKRSTCRCQHPHDTVKSWGGRSLQYHGCRTALRKQRVLRHRFHHRWHRLACDSLQSPGHSCQGRSRLRRPSFRPACRHIHRQRQENRGSLIQQTVTVGYIKIGQTRRRIRYRSVAFVTPITALTAMTMRDIPVIMVLSWPPRLAHSDAGPHPSPFLRSTMANKCEKFSLKDAECEKLLLYLTRVFPPQTGRPPFASVL